MNVGFDVLILLRKLRVQLAHQLARLNRQLLFALDAGILRIGKKTEQMQLLGQFVKSERNILLLALFLLVVNAELIEVARDDPARSNGERQVVGIPFRLLIRRFGTRLLAAYGSFVKTDAAPLHLNQNAHVFIEHVDLAAFDLALEFKRMRGVFQTVDVLKQLDPKRPRMLLLHARKRTPALDKRLRRTLLLRKRNVHSNLFVFTGSLAKPSVSDCRVPDSSSLQCLLSRPTQPKNASNSVLLHDYPSSSSIV